jgi:hypothetical protein
MAVARYGREGDSQLSFKAHIMAANIALTGDYPRYIQHCKTFAIETKDKDWKKSLNSTS